MRYGIEIHQTHDAAGQPDVRLFAHDLPERVSSDAALDDLYAFLRRLEPTRTGRPGEYWYRDPERGHGVIRVLGLDAHDARQVEERIQLHELERAIGMRDPALWGRHSPNRRMFRNPWISTALAASVVLAGFFFVLQAIALHSTPGRGPAATWVGAGFGVVFAALGVVLAMQHLPRIPWWSRARAAVRTAGLPMPSDLSPFE